MTFENGYTISVQFDAGNYCQNHDKYRELNLTGAENMSRRIADLDYKLGHDGSLDAEIAIIKPDKELLEFPDGEGTVKGYLSADEVLKWMNYAASLPKGSKDD